MKYKVNGYLLKDQNGTLRWEQELIGYFEEKDFPIIFEQGMENGYNTLYYTDEDGECRTLKSWIKENK